MLFSHLAFDRTCAPARSALFAITWVLLLPAMVQGQVPDSATHVHDQVRVEPTGAAIEEVEPAAPERTAGDLAKPTRRLPPDSPPTSDQPLLPREGWLVLGGPYLRSETTGAELGVAGYVSERLRLGVNVSVGYDMQDTKDLRVVLALTRIGRARVRRVDYGARIGAVHIGGRGLGWTAVGLLGWGWELDGLGLSVRGELGAQQVYQETPELTGRFAATFELPI